MIDRRLLLNDFEGVSSNLCNRNIDKSLIKNLSKIILEFKELKMGTELKQASQHDLSRRYSDLMRQDSKNLNTKNQTLELSSGSHAELKKQLDELKVEIKNNNEKLDILESNLNNLLMQVPNLLDSSTPYGTSESDNVEIKKVLNPKEFNFKAKEHWELAQNNCWIDFKGGIKLAKSRFSVLRGMGAKLNKALISYMLDFNERGGFEICSVPVVVNDASLVGTGQLPKFKDDMFKLENTMDEESGRGHELYLISTSEISLINLYQDEIIDSNSLPIKLTASTPCFRKEAGSARRDTRGIIRQHQFDKVEIVAITAQDKSEEMQEFMINHISSLLESLHLPHRLVQLCSTDIGFSASSTVDIEVWLPGQGCYREISSISNCRDFQARRAKIRYRDGNKNILAHTLNGSSVAVGRALVAIMENYQDRDGNIAIPEVLKRYL